jgi:hypothetical protein
MFKTSNVVRSDPERAGRKFRFWVIVISLVLLGIALTIAIAVGIHDHSDHVLAAQMTQSEARLKTTGARIADIKDREFKSMADYVNAYAQVEPVLNDYDHTLREYVDLCNRAQLRDETGLLNNIRPRRRRHNSAVCRNTGEVIELIGQINEVMKKEVSVIRDMNSLPEKEQVQFWHEEFVPLMAQERALRETLLSVGQRMSPESTLH